MGNGYAGKILVVDLTKRSTSTLNTSDYKEYGGGHGMGSAVFFDLCKDKTVAAFDPGNVLTVMTGPLQGTLTPFASGRCEVQGIAPEGYPTEWYSRSGFGGRFSGQLKFAGWDGIAVMGKADKPVWIDIRDQKIAIRDASASGDKLWGLDTVEVEKRIYELVRNGDNAQWTNYGGSRDSGRSTLNPGVLSCGPAGENLSRTASLIHEGGGGAGQGGFGAVFGSKNLKSISVIGTGSVEVADPKALMEARAWAQGSWWDIDKLKPGLPGMYTSRPSGATGVDATSNVAGRDNSCLGCYKSCHGGRTTRGLAPNSSCFDSYYALQSKFSSDGATSDNAVTTDRLQRLGINAWEGAMAGPWLVGLYKQGILGPGKQIDTKLNFADYGSEAFNKAFLEAIAYRTDIGADLAEGCARAAEKWGRYEEDTTSGALAICGHGYAHHYDARTEVEWGFGTAIGDRDINEHDIALTLYWYTSMAPLYGVPYIMPAKDLVEMIGATLLPYKDPMMLDYSDTGMYSDAMVKFVSWHRNYNRFWKQSAIFCDWGIADWINPYTEGYKGLTPEVEPRFFNAVTGQHLTFEEGMTIGAKIWNLDRAIWVLQGRTRDGDALAEWQFAEGKPAAHSTYEIPYIMTVFENGAWAYKNVWGRTLDHAKFEDFKTRFYAFEGWDTKTGIPTRATLEKLGLGKAADELAAAKKI
jgi:aldehyde:ferredoxin oxidoreductase